MCSEGCIEAPLYKIFLELGEASKHEDLAESLATAVSTCQFTNFIYDLHPIR